MFIEQHIFQNHGATIVIIFQEDHGTTITVKFSKRVWMLKMLGTETTKWKFPSC
jgi:hypothetical protein